MEEQCFPSDPIQAIKLGFANADKEILSKNDKSGSSAVIVLIVKNVCYIAHVGDSRTILGV